MSGARDTGSVLLLMPAAVLIVLVLAAIAVDTAIVHLARRELVAGADSAANDAVTYGLDERRFRAGEGYRLDPDRVEQAVLDTLEADGLLDRLSAPPQVTVTGQSAITVELTMQVEYVFAKALPGDTSTPVTARSTAWVEQG